MGEFFRKRNPGPTDYQYNETAPSGALQNISYPTKGYSVFFYEPHQYWDGTANVEDGGIRVKQIINYDGVSSNHDNIQDFEYKAETETQVGSSFTRREKISRLCVTISLTINGVVRTPARVSGY
jgi:hypothetical protein